VISQLGVSYANNYDFDDQNVSFSGSIAFDQARKLNVRNNAAFFMFLWLAKEN
jgi:hypothetical protein